MNLKGVTGSIWHATAMFTLDFNCENAAKITSCTYDKGPINLFGNFSTVQILFSSYFDFQISILSKIKMTNFIQFLCSVINQQ